MYSDEEESETDSICTERSVEWSDKVELPSLSLKPGELNPFFRYKVGEFNVNKFLICQCFEINFVRHYRSISKARFLNVLFECHTGKCPYCERFEVECDLVLTENETRNANTVVSRFLEHIKHIEIELNKVLIYVKGTRDVSIDPDVVVVLN